jgi:hypothetical protein
MASDEPAHKPPVCAKCNMLVDWCTAEPMCPGRLTPAPQAEPSDEALIREFRNRAVSYARHGSDERSAMMDSAEHALRARLASNAEALAKAQGRIAELEALIAGSKKVTAGVFNVAVNAEAALAECRTALMEAAENISREYDSEYAGRTEVYCTSCDARLTDDDKHEDGCAWTAIDRALAKEAPRHE